MSREYDGPSWLNYVIRHCEDNDSTFDRYTVEIEFEWREAGDEDGNTSEHESFHFGMSYYPTHPQGFSQYGEGWIWERDSPDTIAWEDLPFHIRQHVLLRCVQGNEHLKPVAIWFDNEFSEGNLEEINPKDYGIDISKYLYKENTNG